MPEKGAPPAVHPIQKRVLRVLGALSSPLLPDDYLELINPLWSTRELRGRIEEINHETADAATVLIKPGYRWPGHKPGQYLRIGLDIEGVRHWRAYSLTSDPWREDGLISITVKNVDEGKVSPYLVRRGRPGTIVSLGGVEGDFILPEERPGKLLFISAGSGITPIMSMLRHLDHSGEVRDVVMLHSARHTDDVIFGDELRGLAERHEGFRLHEQLTRDNGRMGPGDLDRLCPDWTERDTYPLRPGGHARRIHRALGAARRLRRAPHGTLSTEAWAGGGGRGRGRRDRVPARPTARRNPTARCRFSWPARRRASICPTAVARGSATRASGSFARDACVTSATGRYTARKAK